MADIKDSVANVRKRAVLAAVVQAALLALVVSAFAVTFVEVGGRFLLHPTIGKALLLMFALIVGCVALGQLLRVVFIGARQKSRMVPYFRNKDFRRGLNRGASEESWAAFRGGYGLVADLAVLDDLAHDAGVTPLSRFGFGDDLFKQRPEWTDLADGLRTVSALAESLTKKNTSRQVSAMTLPDLLALVAALKKALETQSMFALIVRYGRDELISGVETAKREGTFWC